MGGYAHPTPLTGANQVVRALPGIYCGLTVRETAGATAAVRIFDHASAASGTLLETITLSPGESRAEFYPGGIWAANGIYVAVVSGSIEGSVRIG